MWNYLPKRKKQYTGDGQFRLNVLPGLSYAEKNPGKGMMAVCTLSPNSVCIFLTGDDFTWYMDQHLRINIKLRVFFKGIISYVVFLSTSLIFK